MKCASNQKPLQKAKDAGNDTVVALLEFRNSPITGMNESSAQLLMGRRLQSTLPMLPSLLEQNCNKGVKEKLHKSTIATVTRLL